MLDYPYHQVSEHCRTEQLVFIQQNDNKFRLKTVLRELCLFRFGATGESKKDQLCEIITY